MNEFDARHLAALEARLAPVVGRVELAVGFVGRWASAFLAYWCVAFLLVGEVVPGKVWPLASAVAGAAAVLVFMKSRGW